METQKQFQFYPLLNNKVLNPPTLGSVLEIFYASNQKYFTVEQLQKEIQMSTEDIEKALRLLNNLGDIGMSEKRSFVDNHFFVDTDGSVKHLKNSVRESKQALHILEKILAQRNDENEALNAFIKNTILFYSEVLDFITLKIDEQFNH